LRRIIRAPTNKSNLVPRPLPALQIILDIKHGIPTPNALFTLFILTLRVQELFAEDAVIGVFGRFFDDNLFPVVGDLVDDPFCVFAQLELVEGGDALGCYGDTVEEKVLDRRDKTGSEGGRSLRLSSRASGDDSKI
jgi:hypothetical protein